MLAILGDVVSFKDRASSSRNRPFRPMVHESDNRKIQEKKSQKSLGGTIMEKKLKFKPPRKEEGPN